MFSSYVASMIPFPVPELVTVHHAEFDEAVQSVFEAIVKFVDPAATVTFRFEGVTSNVGATPACVTVTTMEGSVDALTLIWAIRGLTDTFS